MRGGEQIYSATKAARWVIGKVKCVDNKHRTKNKRHNHEWDTFNHEYNYNPEQKKRYTYM
jgi:hypothetical protein